MNKLIKTKVADIMLRHPETQDNDRELIVRYWKDEISELQNIARERLQSMPYFTLDGFLATFMTGGFTSPDSITRARRQVQEQYPQFRGKKYKERQARQEEVKKELGYQVEQIGGGYTLNKNNAIFAPFLFYFFVLTKKMGINEGVSIFFVYL